MTNPRNFETQRRLKREIAKIKSEIARLRDLRPETLSEQYDICGTPDVGVRLSDYRNMDRIAN